MSKLKSLMTNDLTAWVDFPGIDGFRVNFRFIKREELIKIRSKSLVVSFNKRTRQKEEEVDSNKFIKHYISAAVIGWEGLKIKHLPELLPVDISSLNPEEVIEYSNEEAVELATNSSIFDSFVTETLNDYEVFSRKEEEAEVKN